MKNTFLLFCFFAINVLFAQTTEQWQLDAKGGLYLKVIAPSAGITLPQMQAELAKDHDTSATNEIQLLVIEANELSLTGSNRIELPISEFNATYGTITDNLGGTNAVANWGYLPDGTPRLDDRVYFASPTLNLNKTTTLANLKTALAIPPTDFFRSAGGTLLPDGTADYTEAKTTGGKVGIGAVTTPITELHVGVNSGLTPASYINGITVSHPSSARIYLEHTGAATARKAIQMTDENGTFRINSLSNAGDAVVKPLLEFDHTTGDLTLGGYPNTRADVTPAVNYLYTDATNKVLSGKRLADFSPPLGASASYQIPSQTAEVISVVPYTSAKSLLYILPTTGFVGQRFILKNTDGLPATISFANTDQATNITIPANTGTFSAQYDGVRWVQESNSATQASITILDNANGTVTVGSEQAIRPINELGAASLVQAAKSAFFDGTNHKSISEFDYQTPTSTAPFVMTQSAAKLLYVLVNSAAQLPSLLTFPIGNHVGQKLIFLNNSGAVATISQNLTEVQPLGVPISLRNARSFVGIWDGYKWTRIDENEGNTINGNSANIAYALNVPPTWLLDFDGFRITMPANAAGRIATTIDNRSIIMLTEQEYPGGSFASGTGVNGTPTLLTTTGVVLDDGVNVAGERYMTSVLDLTKNQLYHIFVWRHGLVSGNWSGCVTKVGITGNTPLTASNGIQIVGNVISNTNQLAITSPITNAQIGTEITLGELSFRYNSNASNGNLEIKSSSGVAVPFRCYAGEKYVAIGNSVSQLFTNASAPISGGGYLTVNANGLDVDAILSYRIITSTNVYNVDLSNFAGTNIHMQVSKAF
jgi:hypothetical protein